MPRKNPIHVPAPMVSHKRCTACGKVKSADKFARASDRVTGLRGRCKGCESRARKTHRLKPRMPEYRQAERRRAAAKQGRAYHTQAELQELRQQRRKLNLKPWRTPKIVEIPPPRGRMFAHHVGAIPEYDAWSSMFGRCYRPTHAKYRYYGARGIKVCDRWRYGDGAELDGFGAFLVDMGAKPDLRLTLQRIDNDRGYEPANCYWATHLEQARNRRPKYSVTPRRKVA
jgi:hypothetical protein